MYLKRYWHTSIHPLNINPKITLTKHLLNNAFILVKEGNKHFMELTVKNFSQDDYHSAQNNMTNEEAIHILDFIKRGFIADYNFTGTEDDFETYKFHVAMKKAIDSLKNK